MDAFTRQYLETALWSSTDDAGEPLDSAYSVDDIAADTVTQAAADCAAFRETYAADLQETNADETQHAHDFWLTRNRHGAGFWDRGYGPAGARLTDAAHAYGSVDLYIGDDGQIHSN